MENQTLFGDRAVSRWERHLLIALLAVGILLRITRLYEMAHHPEWIVPDKDQVDMAFFYNYGQDLAQKARRYVTWLPPPYNSLPPSPVSGNQDSDSCFVRPPAYSVFLAAALLLSGNRLMAPLILQAILGILNALLAWRLTRRIAGPAPALITAAFMLFYWVLIVYEGVYHAQTLMIFLSLLLLNGLERWASQPTLVRAGTAGCLLALNLFATPSSAVFAPAAACWMLAWIKASAPSWKSAVRQAFPHVLTTTLCAAILVSPVTIANWKADGYFTLISTGGGMMLAFGNHDGADGYLGTITGEQLGIPVDSSNYDDIIAYLESVTGRKATSSLLNKLCKDFALTWIKKHPRTFLFLTLKRALIYWQPKEVSHNVQEYCLKQLSGPLRWLPGGFPEILGGLGAVGVLALFSIRRATPAVRLRWMLPFLYSLLFYLPFTVFYYAGHYRVPILPFLAMMAAAGLWSALTGLRSRPAVAGAALACALALWIGTRLIPVNYEDDWQRWFHFRGEAAQRLRGESGLQNLEWLVRTARLTRSPSACLFMAQRATKRQDFDAAAQWCRRGLELETQSMERRVWLLELLFGSLLTQKADPLDLEALAQEIVHWDRDHFLARMFLADQYIQTGAYDEALPELNIALEANPHNGNAWFLLGQCQMALGFPQLAESAYRKGMEMDLADPWPAMGLAGVLEATGRLDEALQAAEEALRRSPDLQAAQETIDRLHLALETSSPSPKMPPNLQTPSH